MNQTSIQNTIKDYIIQELMYTQPDIELMMDTPLIEGNIIDSMGIFRLIAFLEGQFNFTIKHEDIMLESFETINAIADLVKLNTIS